MANKNKKKSFFFHLASALILIIGIILIAVPIALGIILYYNSPIQNGVFIEQDGISRGEYGGYYIEVRKGESAQSVGLRLERAGLIRNRYFWQLLCRFKKEYLKNGTYVLEAPASQMAIHSLLTSGKEILIRVTIPEGVTLKKCAKILEDTGICGADEFLEAANNREIIKEHNISNDSMEGYLFPDTYLFPQEYPASRVIRSMTDNFYKKLREIYPDADALTQKELNQKVILASIIEREYLVSEEAPVMAGVFYNRLKIGMALQSCATVEYIITEIQGKPHPAVLYNRDIEIQDPYNTYIKPGLPPGPISAPGETALKAAFYPAQSDYLYFRLKDSESGSHYFSKTLDEHIKAGALLTKNKP